MFQYFNMFVIYESIRTSVTLQQFLP